MLKSIEILYTLELFGIQVKIQKAQNPTEGGGDQRKAMVKERK